MLNLSLSDQLQMSEELSIVSLPITSVVLEEDFKTSRVAIGTALESGLSKNRNLYSAAVAEALVPHLKSRPKMYVNHVYDRKEALNRAMGDWGATVIEAWSENIGTGVVKTKVKFRFSHMPIGEALYKQAQENPEDLGLSINSLISGRKGEYGGVKDVLIVEDWQFLFSLDFVAYPAAKGGVEAIIGEEFKYIDDLKSEMWLVSENVTPAGVWGATTQKPEEVKTAKQVLEDLFVDLDTFIEAAHAEQYLCELYYAFRSMFDEALNSDDSVEGKKARTEKIINEYFEKVKSVKFPQTKEEVKNMLELKDVLGDTKVLEEVRKHIIESDKLIPQANYDAVVSERDVLKAATEKLQKENKQAKKEKIVQEALFGLNVSSLVKDGLLAIEYDETKEDAFKAAVKSKVEEEKETQKNLISSARKVVVEDIKKEKLTFAETVVKDAIEEENGLNGKIQMTSESAASLFNR